MSWKSAPGMPFMAGSLSLMTLAPTALSLCLAATFGLSGACAMSLPILEHAVGCLLDDARTAPQGLALGGVKFRISQ